ncbi:MAG: hypothetical protein ABF289_09575 [Clostridiales bacterium]
MYKKTENATIEFLNVNFSLVYIELILRDCKKMNINRVVININKSKEILEKMIELYDITEKYDVAVFFKMNNKLYKNIEKKGNIKYIIQIKISEIEKEMLMLSKNIFYETILDFEICNFDNEMWREAFDKIIWDFNLDLNYIYRINGDIEKLISIANNKEIMFSKIFIPLNQIREHPCNVYLCNGMKCHSNHGNNMRYLTVNENGEIYPYHIFVNNYIVGNIFHNSLFDIINIYNNSESKRLFIKASKELFIEISDKYNFTLIPWFEFLKEKIYAEKCKFNYNI